MKKIAYISGTRADFGLMTSVLKAIEKSDKLQLQLYATGMHLMEEYGKTIDAVRAQFPKVEIIDAIFENDSQEASVKFASNFQSKLLDQFRDKPDFVLVLGDRIEMLATSLVCLYLGIPVGHLHGGERTSTVDEIARHAITKLSSLHFAATKESAERILKLGEEEWRVHIVGAPALDTILNEDLPTRDQLFKKLSIDPKSKVILITQHSVSEDIDHSFDQMSETIEAVKIFNLPVVVIYPNTDPGSKGIIRAIDNERNNSLFHIFSSLEYRDFLALEREASVWIGNSSGALIESASFKNPVVNVGERQKGRQRGDNVIDVDYNKEQIRKAIDKSLNDESYIKRLKEIENLWGDGTTGEQIKNILENLDFDEKLIKKQITY